MKKLCIFLLFFLSFKSQAAVEFDFNFGYSKNTYGEERQNKNTTRSYGGSIAFYFLSMTALEFNASHSEEETIQNVSEANEDDNGIIKSQQESVVSETYGVGIRQAFASRKSFLIPTLSVGWARQKYTSSYRVEAVDSNGVAFIYSPDNSITYYDSIFASFALKFRLSRGLSLKASINTTFQAFEWNEARDQLRYSAGFTWIF